MLCRSSLFIYLYIFFIICFYNLFILKERKTPGGTDLSGKGLMRQHYWNFFGLVIAKLVSYYCS